MTIPRRLGTPDLPTPLSRSSARPRLLCRALLLLPIGSTVAFIATAPWTIGARKVDRLTAALGLAAGLWLLLLLWRPWRIFLWRLIVLARPRLGATTLAAVFCLAALFLARVVFANYQSLRVNAWDFSVFDLSLAGGPQPVSLYDPVQHAALLGVHAYYLPYAFIPLYLGMPSPWWLLLSHALALAAAGTVAVLVVGEICGDGLAALCLGTAFLLNSFTAKIANYPFHPEVFYPLALFLVLLGFLRRRPAVFAVGILLAILIKEDAVLPLLGFAGAAALLRRPGWASVAFGTGAAAFLVGVFLLMPHVSGSLPGHPWYAGYWGAYGATPLGAARGMLTHPGRVVSDLARSGVTSLLETLCFLPLAGAEWLLASVPCLIIYGVAGGGRAGLSQFSLYYSAPVLPLLLAAAARGLMRLSRWPRGDKRPPGVIRTRRRLRLGALAVLVVSALDGASFRFWQPRPEAQEVRTYLALVPEDVPVRVQGALLPHAGYRAMLTPIDPLRPVLRTEAVLLDLSANPYPLTEEQLRRLEAELRSDPERRTRTSPGGLMLFSSDCRGLLVARRQAWLKRE